MRRAIAHERMETFAAEDPGGDPNGECAGAECGEHHDVEGFPDAPAEGVVHAADRAEAGEFAIDRQAEGDDGQSSEADKKAVDDRECRRPERSAPSAVVVGSLP